MAMGTVQSIFNNNSSVIQQIPPQISGLYGKSRAGFPLGFGHASSYVDRGAALIGYTKISLCFHFACKKLPNDYDSIESFYQIY